MSHGAILRITLTLLGFGAPSCGSHADRDGQGAGGQSRMAEMNDDGFWRLISLFDWDKTGDDSAVVAPVVAALSKLTEDEIVGFDETLAKKLFALDGEAYARNIGEGAYTGRDDFFSVDGFLYSRCAVVANGRDYFESVLINAAAMPKDLEFEPLLYVAADAYTLKTGKEFSFSTETSYETFSNRSGWK